MALRLGDEAPDFTAETTEGTINFHEYLGDGWGVLFSHPKDFTPVCTTELGMVAQAQARVRQAQREGHRPLASTRSTRTRSGPATSRRRRARKLNFPLIADSDRKVSDLYDMIHPNANDTLTVRSVFIDRPRQEGEAHHHLPGERPGRNFDEILRVDRLAPAHRRLQRGHAGELEGRRRRHHRRRRSPTRTPRRSSRRAGRRSSPTSGSRPSPTSNSHRHAPRHDSGPAARGRSRPR